MTSVVQMSTNGFFHYVDDEITYFFGIMTCEDETHLKMLC